jgi:hypothetical protein
MDFSSPFSKRKRGIRPQMICFGLLKNCAEGRDPSLCGFCKCSHIEMLRFPKRRTPRLTA